MAWEKGKAGSLPSRKEQPVQRHGGKRDCVMFEEQRMVPEVRTWWGRYMEEVTK